MYLKVLDYNFENMEKCEETSNEERINKFRRSLKVLVDIQKPQNHGCRKCTF
jgi:hypothetical protein